jgi:hypothetical protein
MIFVQIAGNYSGITIHAIISCGRIKGGIFPARLPVAGRGCITTVRSG